MLGRMRERRIVEKRLAELKEELVERRRPVTALGRHVDAVEGEIRAHERELASIDDRAREAEAHEKNQATNDARLKASEEAAFWFRRFFTTLGIANAGAFAALASGVLQADKPGDVATYAAPAMISFTWGLLWAGAVPLVLWLQAQTEVFLNPTYTGPASERALYEWIGILCRILTPLATTFSVAYFCDGLFKALGSVQAIPR